jgi:deoxyadenosine/deoxycytidine kinase/NTP pyrophosphatase (non-canonical NTP hydrolase)
MDDRQVVGTLRELQQLQQSFDISRGFDFTDALNALGENAIREDILLQFSALALCGEVGELANNIKKTVRAKLLNQEESSHRDGARHELGDVLAYLLKMSNLLNEDLTLRYLQQMCENALRFSAKTKVASGVVAIVGPSGAGKSTTVRKLAERLGGVRHFLENAPANPFLATAQSDSSTPDLTYQSQDWFARQQEEFLAGVVPGELAILDQDPAAITLVYSRRLWQAEMLTLDHYEHFLARLLELELSLGRRLGNRLMILLDAPAEVLWERARHRTGGDPGIDWFKDLRLRFLEVYEAVPNCVIVDSHKFSPEDIIDTVTTQIERKLALPIGRAVSGGEMRGRRS